MIPDTAEGLEDRYNHLFLEFTREKQYENGHELAILSDKMLDRGLVTPIEYSKLNSLIAVPAEEEDENAVPDKKQEEEDEMSRVIKETVDCD